MMTAVAVTTIIFTVFITGVVAGVIGVVAVAVHRTERNHALTVPAADPVSRTGRWLNGVYVRAPALAREPSSPTGASAHAGPAANLAATA
jgi:hypothetical protein